MPSNYTGDGTTFSSTIPLLTDGDRPAAQLWRVPEQLLLDNDIYVLAHVTTLESNFISVLGGTYNLNTADLHFSGTHKVILDASQIPSSKTLTLDGIISLSSTGRINLASGSGINYASGSSANYASGSSASFVSGSSATFASGASLNLDGTCTVSGTGVVSLASGAALNLASGSTTTFDRVGDLKIASQIYTRRVPLIPAVYRPDGAWEMHSVGLWEQADVAGSDTLIFPIRVLPGDVISAVVLRCTGTGSAGGHAALPASMPSFTLIEVDFSGTQTSIGSVTDTSATQAAYDASHLITLSSGLPYTATTNCLYLQATGESGANALVNRFRITGISVTGTRTQIANNNDIG